MTTLSDFLYERKFCMLKIVSLGLLGVICLAIFVMHVICNLVSSVGEEKQKRLEYVNIAFHVLMIIPLFFLGYSIEIAVLFFMASVFVHTALGAISVKLHKPEPSGEELSLAADNETGPMTDGEASNSGEVSA